MASDPEFEAHLFAAFGEPSCRWGDDGLTERLLSRLDREDRLRAGLLTAAVVISAAAATTAMAVVARPLMAQLAGAFDAPIPLIWAAIAMAALLVGTMGARIAVDG